MRRLASSPLGGAGVIAISYLLFGSLYISVSGRLAAALAGSVEELKQIEQYKGLVFIWSTGLGLFLLSYALLARTRRLFLELAEDRERLALFQQRALASEMAAAVTHDFRNLLSVVASAIEEAREEPEHSAMLELLDEAKLACTRGGQLADRLMSAARGNSDAERTRQCLAPLVSEILGLLRHSDRVRRCQVETVLDPSACVPVDGTLLSQIVSNLVLNAADATDGRGRIRVSVQPCAEGGALAVADDGPGIPEDEQNTIFDPFHSSKSKGWGVGLLAVHLAVKAHGGTITVSRSDLGGALMTVILPSEPASVRGAPSLP